MLKSDDSLESVVEKLASLVERKHSCKSISPGKLSHVSSKKSGDFNSPAFEARPSPLKKVHVPRL
jgi:hypothetical protein